MAIHGLYPTKLGVPRPEWSILLGLAWLLFPASAARALAGPEKMVGRVTTPDERRPLDQISHASWTRLLQKYVDRQGMVDYSAWQASVVDLGNLDLYLDQLSLADLDVPVADEARIAYWINAYNAVTIKGILLEYPTSSIRNHTPRLWGYHIWKDLKLRVDGRQWSLDEIEHEILRKLAEPRIHFAIVCASIGCPRLLDGAYTAEELEKQLTENARHFFADPNKFQADLERQTLAVSPILEWFAEDFGHDLAAQLESVSPYLPPEARELARSGRARVRYLDYDWDLNDQAPPAR